MCFGETRPIINEFTVTRSAAFGQNITQSPHGVSCWHYYNCDMRRSEIEYNFVWFAFCNQNDGTVIFVGFMAGSKLVGSICSRFLRLLGPARDGLFSFSTLFLHSWCLLSRVRCLCRPTLFRSTGRLDSAKLFELLFVQEILMTLENETLQSQEEWENILSWPKKNREIFGEFSEKWQEI